jgi:hypothetical protein
MNMKIEHLEERITDYKESIKGVVDKKVQWNDLIKPLLHKTLKEITVQYELGWRVQELNWIHNNEALNISFDSFPKDLIDWHYLIKCVSKNIGGMPPIFFCLILNIYTL